MPKALTSRNLIMLGFVTGIVAYLASRNEAVREFASRIAQRVSERGKSLIKEFEGLRLKPYFDIAGHKTIGYGILLTPTHPLYTASQITMAQAEQLLSEHIAKNIDPVISRYVKVPLAQNQYDALASWLYNFSETHLSKSTLLKKLNVRDYQGAADEFLRWNKARVGGVLQEVPGLTRRRQKKGLYSCHD